MDYLLKHEGEQAVNHVQFLVNEVVEFKSKACNNEQVFRGVL